MSERDEACTGAMPLVAGLRSGGAGKKQGGVSLAGRRERVELGRKPRHLCTSAEVDPRGEGWPERKSGTTADEGPADESSASVQPPVLTSLKSHPRTSGKLIWSRRGQIVKNSVFLFCDFYVLTAGLGPNLFRERGLCCFRIFFKKGGVGQRLS